MTMSLTVWLLTCIFFYLSISVHKSIFKRTGTLHCIFKNYISTFCHINIENIFTLFVSKLSLNLYQYLITYSHVSKITLFFYQYTKLCTNVSKQPFFCINIQSSVLIHQNITSTLHQIIKIYPNVWLWLKYFLV